MADHEEGHKSSGHGGGGGHGHGGGSHEEAHEGAPEWLISFADNTALMMGFFVILLALNMKPAATGAGAAEGAAASEQSSMLDWAISVREAFNNPVDVNSTNPSEAALVQRLRDRQGRGNALDPGERGQHDEVETIRPSDYVGAGGVARFADGSAAPEDETVRIIGDIAGRLRGKGNRIEVRGHASAAEGYHAADQGFELSYKRAMAVAAGLVQGGVEWRRIRIVAAANNERAVTPEYDATAQAENRRVEVIELPDRAQDDGPAPNDPTAPATSGAPH